MKKGSGIRGQEEEGVRNQGTGISKEIRCLTPDSCYLPPALMSGRDAI